MSISRKIKFGFGVLLALLGTQFVVQQMLAYAIQSRVNTAITQNFAAADALAEITSIAQQLRRFEKEYFIYVNDQSGRAKYRKEWTDAYDKLSDNLAKMAANAGGEFGAGDVTAFSNWMLALKFYGDEFKSIMDKAEAGTILSAAVVAGDGKKDAAPLPAANISQATRIANDMIGRGKDRFKEVLDGAQTLRKEKSIASAQSVTEIRTFFSIATVITFAVFFFGLIVAIYLITILPRTVRQAIDGFVGIADKMSKGDLKQVIQAEGVIEFHALAKALERLRVAQAGLLERVRAKATAPSQV
jgi:methyl-accepting chemotaxis protein